MFIYREQIPRAVLPKRSFEKLSELFKVYDRCEEQRYICKALFYGRIQFFSKILTYYLIQSYLLKR